MRSTVPIRQGRMRPSVQRRRVQGRRKVTLGGKLLLLLLIALLFILLPPLLFAGDRGSVNLLTHAAATGRSPIEVSVGQGQADAPNPTLKVYNTESKSLMELDLEEYICGVVAAEMPASFEIEALKAQAVAARTFVCRHLPAFGGQSAGCPQGADACTNYAHCQAYISPEKRQSNWGAQAQANEEKIRSAVEQTRGQVATYNGELIQAFFHSTSGGMTEDCALVFTQDLPYLKAVESAGEEGAPHYQRSVTLSAQAFAQKVNAALPKAGLKADALQEQVDASNRSGSGRVLQLRLGGATMSGTTFRSLLGLDSTNFEISFSGDQVTILTHGYGHGVGMSQVGADAMAKNGSDYREILLHYYTGIAISTLG
ncbi:H-34 [uncultured Clostridium sp.]|nr:H-34 [uncultured Clostridium sp.]